MDILYTRLALVLRQYLMANKDVVDRKTVDESGHHFAQLAMFVDEDIRDGLERLISHMETNDVTEVMGKIKPHIDAMAPLVKDIEGHMDNLIELINDLGLKENETNDI